MANTRGNLPTDLSSFVGRGQEVRELRQLLSEARLVSVVGPGGVGKSRLAVCVGDQLLRSVRDGVWLVELASVTDSSLVPEAMASALGVPERAGRDSTEALRQYLAGRELVLVLDNCEKLRDACAATLTTILTHAPGLRVLATSQEVLGLPGEAVYQLHPLALPEPGETVEQVELSPTVVLFSDRAAKALHGFKVSPNNVEAVVELCRRLDGLPLAIELAAAHARYLSPEQMLEHIGDRFHLLASRSSTIPARHRSLKAAVEWSWDLCSKPARLVWSRLSVFPSTFDLSAAEAVCADNGLTGPDVMEAVGELVDRSVLISEPHQRGMRYRLLESIHDFGLQMLRDSQDAEHAIPEEALGSRHLRWYSSLAAEFDRDWFGPRQHDWLTRVKADLPNIRAALSFAAGRTAHREEGLRLAGNLCFFWRVDGLREGEAWLTRLLGDGDPEPSQGRARALLALAWLLAARGQPDEATVARALAATERFDPERVPRVLLIGGTFAQGPDLPKTRTLLEDALDNAGRFESAADRAFALYGMAWNLGLAGLADEAESHFRESLSISAATGDLWWRGAVQFRHALIGWMQGDQGLMAAAAADALRASRLVPDLLTCANAVGLLGVAAVGRDDRLAARLFGAAERFWDDAGGSAFSVLPWQALLGDATTRCRVKIGTTTFEELYRSGRDHDLSDAIAAALDEQPPQSEDHPARQRFGLTRRELEVVALIAQGLTNRAIASKLVISVRTAETHVQNILIKTGFSTRSQLAAWHTAQTHDSRK